MSKETTPNAATTKYTNFLLATASGKVDGVKGPGELATPFEKTKLAAYTLGAMAPSLRLYVFLGKEIKSLVDANGDDHPYMKWIDKYSSETYQVRKFLLFSVCYLGLSQTHQNSSIYEKIWCAINSNNVNIYCI